MKYELIQNDRTGLSAMEIVLTNRGIELEDIQHYLTTSAADIIPSNEVVNMREGAKMLVKHIQNNDKIFIQVDCDADGYCSSAILINYLYSLFPYFTTNNVIYRLHDGKEHGVILGTIPEGTKLVIIPDAGSNQFLEHKALKEEGKDILVIDHHEAMMESEDACVINNQLGDYPTKSLCGGAMVLKFCTYIDELLGTNNAKEYIDLAALALISDMMDIRDFETIEYIRQGLASIRNPFFQAMVHKQEYSLKDGLSPINIAFYITPYINATIRVGSQEEKKVMFESMLEMYSEDLIPSTKRGYKGQFETRVEQACRNCMNIKKHQGQERDKEAERIEKIIEEENLLENKILAVRLPEGDVNKNLTGLIANELMSKYQKPTLLLSSTGDSWAGSARNFDKSDFKLFKDFCATSGLINYAEGHQGAFGFSIAKDKFNDFIEYANKKLAQYDFTPSYKVDFIFSANNFNKNDILEVAELKSLWGQNMSEALIAIEDIKISKENVVLMSPDKSPTIKITLPNGTTLIKFKASVEEYEQLTSSTGCLVLTVVGTCNSNTWNGITTPQVLIEEYEITGELKYLF